MPENKLSCLINSLLRTTLKHTVCTENKSVDVLSEEGNELTRKG